MSKQQTFECKQYMSYQVSASFVQWNRIECGTQMLYIYTCRWQRLAFVGFSFCIGLFVTHFTWIIVRTRRIFRSSNRFCAGTVLLLTWCCKTDGICLTLLSLMSIRSVMRSANRGLFEGPCPLMRLILSLSAPFTTEAENRQSVPSASGFSSSSVKIWSSLSAFHPKTIHGIFSVKHTLIQSLLLKSTYADSSLWYILWNLRIIYTNRIYIMKFTSTKTPSFKW